MYGDNEQKSDSLLITISIPLKGDNFREIREEKRKGNTVCYEMEINLI